MFPCSVDLQLLAAKAKRRRDSEGSPESDDQRPESVWSEGWDDDAEGAAGEGDDGVDIARQQSPAPRSMSRARRRLKGSRGGQTGCRRPSRRRPAKKRTYGNGLTAFYETVRASFSLAYRVHAQVARPRCAETNQKSPRAWETGG